MTIKNTKKNISAEDEYVITGVTNTASTKSNNKSNFSTAQTIRVTKEKFFDETNRNTSTTDIEIPLNELVRLGYLQDQYYDKTYIDRHIKVHIEILQSRPYPNDNAWATKWAADVRTAQKTNYIFLVAFPSNPNNETHQDGGYEEYYYAIDEGHADNDYSSERMESAGSLIIDLSDYLREENFHTTLVADQSFITLSNTVAGHTTDISNLQSSKLNKTISDTNSILVTDGSGQISGTPKIGNIDKNGKLWNGNSVYASKIVTTDSNGVLVGSSELLTSVIKNSAALNSRANGLGLAANSTQNTINDKIDEKINYIYSTSLPLYLLKSEIDAEIWGTSGFKAARTSDTVANQSLKLGDYIYQYLYANFYTKTEINSMIGEIARLSTQTLGIL